MRLSPTSSVRSPNHWRPRSPRRSKRIGTATDGVRPRLDTIDWLRGFVIALMALDHCRDALGDARLHPTQMGETDAPLFLTRWVTHLCAPTFVFLTGVGAYLACGRGRSRRDLAGFLVSRGLWLIVLEMGFLRLFWTLYDFSYQNFVAQVIWAIGLSMVALAGLVMLPRWAVGLVGFVIVAGHNLLDPVRARDLGEWAGLWRVLHERGMVPFDGGGGVFIAYPVAPWIGVMALGYACGGLFVLDRPRRRRVFALIGTLLVAGFVALRMANDYGDPKPWREQGTPMWTVFSFVNCQKYPPSLAFLMMTLGLSALVMAWADREKGPPGRWLVTFGRVPLFFYLLHLPFIHAITGVVYLTGLTMGWYGGLGETLHTTGLQVGLVGVYVAWAIVLLALYPACRWFAGVKQRNRSVWLSYL